MDSKKLTLAITFIVVIIVSIFLGSAVGRSDQTTPMVAITILVVLLLIASLGEGTWVLIPIFAAWSGQISVLPLPFSVSNLVVFLTAFVFMLSIATRRQTWNYKAEAIDVVLGLTLALLAIGYMRNPVGVAALTSGSNVGGRPYAEVGIAFVAYLVLAGQDARASLIAAIPRWVLISTALLAVGGGIATALPAAGVVLYQFYSGFMPDLADVIDPYSQQEGIGRLELLRPLAFALTAYVGAKCNPLRLFRVENWWLVGLLAVALAMSLISGYRSALVAITFYFVCASWLWLRGAGLAICGFLGIGFLAAIIMVQSFIPLPDRVQRSMSFLPGPWDDRVVRSAEGSTEWRLEMWEIVLEGDNIKNWWIGDGFGFPRSEYEYFGYLQMSGQISSHQLAEYYLITGSLHSGPLSALKFAGVIGGVFYVVLAVMIFVGYVKLWNSLQWYPSLGNLRVTVGFFTILASYVPFKFVFIFGAYNNDLSTLIISAGVYRVIASSARKEMAAGDEQSQDAVQDPSPSQVSPVHG